MQGHENYGELSQIEKLFDENNTDSIVLFDENGESVEFEQIAVVPYKGNIYAILKPVLEMEGIAEDEALVFSIKEGAGELIITEDEDVIDAVFEEYYDLINEEL